MKHTVEEIRLKNGARGLFIDVADADSYELSVSVQGGQSLCVE